MAFTNGNTDIDTLLNQWVNDLIATGQWVDNDVTWNGSRRSIRHAVDANFFLAFERMVSQLPADAGVQAGNALMSVLEVRITVSSAWVANAPSGTIRYTGVPVTATQTSNGNNSGAIPFGAAQANSTRTGQHWTWVDSDGIVSLFRATASASWDYTFCLIIDRITAKEYADGATNMHILAFVNFDASAAYNQSGSINATRTGYYNPSTFGAASVLTRNSYIRAFLTEATTLTNGVERYIGAFRSPGNSKAYFLFPFYSNSATTPQRSPIAITDKWLLATQAQGLADGDILDYTAPGPLLKRYLVKTLDCPDNLTAIEIAMRFA